jgi:hypothetical protein
MKPSRTLRLVTVVVAIFSMLFMQLAMAGYVCPGSSPAGERTFAQVSAMAPDMVNCEDMDTAQATLCHLHTHGEPAKQSLDTKPVPDTSPFVPLVLILTVQSFMGFSVPTAQPFVRVDLARSSAPPIAIRNCCFRI